MGEINYNRQIQALFHGLNLGAITQSIEPLAGGLLHRMFRVISEKGKFAVKALNPQIMSRSDAVKKTVCAERIASIAAKHIPASCAKMFDGKAIQAIDGQLYLIYDLIDGKCMSTDEIKRFHCERMGDILADLHGLDFSVLGMDGGFSTDVGAVDWPYYYQKGLESNPVWLGALKSNLAQLSAWNEKAIHSAAKLSGNSIISHRDLDPKNVMWRNDNPIIIDWEAAGYINPMCDFVDTALYWAKNAAGQWNEDYLFAFAKTYRKKNNDFEIDCLSVLDYGFAGKLGWLEYNLKRSLDIESSDRHDRQTGTDQVVDTLEEINRYAYMIPAVERSLKKCMC